MSKQQVIEAIRKQNPSAKSEFLANFSQQSLETYLHRLTHISGCRGRDSIWVRNTVVSAADAA